MKPPSGLPTGIRSEDEYSVSVRWIAAFQGMRDTIAFAVQKLRNRLRQNPLQPVIPVPLRFSMTLMIRSRVSLTGVGT